MTCGILASGSCLLTDISDQLHEPSKKINTVDRLSRHLSSGTDPRALMSYLSQVKKMASSEHVVYIDDSDIVKPEGKDLFRLLSIGKRDHFDPVIREGRCPTMVSHDKTCVSSAVP